MPLGVPAAVGEEVEDRIEPHALGLRVVRLGRLLWYSRGSGGG